MADLEWLEWVTLRMTLLGISIGLVVDVLFCLFGRVRRSVMSASPSQHRRRSQAAPFATLHPSPSTASCGPSTCSSEWACWWKCSSWSAFPSLIPDKLNCVIIHCRSLCDVRLCNATASCLERRMRIRRFRLTRRTLKPDVSSALALFSYRLRLALFHMHLEHLVTHCSGGLLSSPEIKGPQWDVAWF